MPIRDCPDPVRELGALLLVQIADLDEKIGELDNDLRQQAREDEQTKRLMSVPGVGTVCAMAIQACRPPGELRDHLRGHRRRPPAAGHLSATAPADPRQCRLLTMQRP